MGRHCPRCKLPTEEAVCPHCWATVRDQGFVPGEAGRKAGRVVEQGVKITVGIGCFLWLLPLFVFLAIAFLALLKSL